MLRIAIAVTSLALVGCATNRSYVGAAVTDVRIDGTRLAVKACDLEHVETDTTGVLLVLSVLTLGAALAGAGSSGGGGGGKGYSAKVSGCRTKLRTIPSAVQARSFVDQVSQ